MDEKIKLISDSKKIDSVLKKYWGKQASKKKIVKPKFKVILIYSESKNKINGYIYAHDINDGYFHWCVLDDLSTGEKFNAKISRTLIIKLINYCEKEKIESIEGEITNSDERKLFKKLNFKNAKEKKETATFILNKNIK